jgi:antitoxin component YwqK of YwqJK toxin-antitoxin module
MRRFLFTILLSALALFCALAQDSTDSINQLDNDDRRTGVWEIYYDNGELKETGNYQEGEKVGFWKTYYKHGTIKHEITYSDGSAKGPARFYYRDGTIWEEGYWDETHWKGEYDLYHANGQKFYDWEYDENGSRTGEQKYYHSNGELQYSGKWENGKAEGEIEVYNESGDLIEKRHYAGGSFDKSTLITLRPTNNETDSIKEISPFYGTGHYTLFEKDGQIVKEGYFREGKLQDGKHYIYNEEDSLIDVKIVENGKYN